MKTQQVIAIICTEIKIPGNVALSSDGHPFCVCLRLLCHNMHLLQLAAQLIIGYTNSLLFSQIKSLTFKAGGLLIN
jgi:hypothetical protein